MEATVSYLLMPQKYINSKQKTQIKDYALCLGNISKDFTINNMKKKKKRKKKTGLKGVVNVFSDFIDTDRIDIVYILTIF